MADENYTINETVFARSDPVSYRKYVKRKKSLYDEYIKGGSSENAAQDSAGLIARREFYQTAVKAGAAADPNNPTASTVPVPDSSKPKPLATTTPRPTTTTTPKPPPPPTLAPRSPQSTTGTTGTEGTTNTSGSGATAKSSATPNILHNFVNYTYRLSLYVLRASEFNRLVSGDKVNPTLLISSAGTGKNKAKVFDLDFYFEDLDVSTIISPTSSNRETNAYDINFTIFEPNGCTLIDRLLAITKDLTGPGEDNYLTMPYLLEISFLGYDEMGNPQAVDVAQKTIPVYLTEMKIKPSLDGTRYAIRAQPFNQNALTQTAGTVPVNCEIKADTVGALFKSTGVIGSGLQSALSDYEKKQRQAQETLNKSDNALERDTATRDLANSQVEVKKPILSSSLGDMLNEWQDYLVKNGMIEVADEYDFIFEPAIGLSKVILPPLNPAQDLPTNNSTKNSQDAPTQALLNARRAGIALSSTGVGLTRIFAGSAITQILAYAVRHCSFILDQLPDDGPPPQTSANNTDARGAAATDSSRNNSRPAAKEEKILKWFWITPRVEIGKFDKIRNTYAKKITYIVSIYDSPNPRYPDAPQGRAKDYVKEYNYWYTGDNTDILNVDINFDTAFYTSVSVRNSADLQGRVRPPVGGNDTNSDEQARRAAERSRMLAKTGLPFPVVTYPSKQQADLRYSSQSGISKKAIAVDDLAESLMSRSRGDMVTMRLEILGDPEFIKQDGLFGDIPDRSSNKTNDSLTTNHGRVIVKFNFDYPNDWDREQGLLTAKSHPTVFAGLYGVVKVESKFQRGMFKQTLDLYRLDDKEYAKPSLET